MKNTLSVRLGKSAFFLMLLLFFVLIYFLNSKTPIWSDDWAFFVAYQQNRIQNFSEIISSTGYFYQHVNGRTFANLIAMFFVYVGKNIFNILNAFMFVCLAILINIFSSTKRRVNIAAMIAIFMLLWFTIPSFNQTIFWFCGSIVYLWMSVFSLLFLFVYFMLKDECKFLLPLIFTLGLLAGNSHELLAPIIFFAVFVKLVLDYKRTGEFSLRNILGVFGVLVGLMIQIFAPGNFAKLTSTGGNSNNLLLSNSRKIIEVFARQEYLWEMVVLIVILFFINRFFFNNKNKIIDKTMIAFLFAAFTLNLLGLFFPYFPPRAMFFSTIALIIFVSRFLLFDNFMMIKRVVIVMFTFLFLWSVVGTIKNANNLFAQYQKREADINEQRQRGEKNIVVDKIKIIKDNKLLNDPLVKSEDHNSWASKFYQVQTIDLN